MKRFLALLLALFVACYPVLAVEEVESDDIGHDSELSDIQAPTDTGEEVEVPAETVVDVLPVETIPSDDVPSQSDNDSSGGSDADSVLDSPDNVENSDIEPPIDVENSDIESPADVDVPVIEGWSLENEIGYDLSVFDSDNPLPVTLVDSDVDYQTVTARGNSPAVVIMDDPPVNPPFYGACYVTGETSSGATVTLYFPSNYKEGYFGVDSNGYLFNVYSSSISGYYEGVYNNSVSCSGFSYPRYRTTSNYNDYITLYLRPTASNMVIATESTPRVSVTQLLPYVSILFLGVIFLCCLKKS